MDEMNAAMRKRRSHRTAPVLRCRENSNSLDGLTLPNQFFPSAQDSHEYWTGARRLMLGVLQDALVSWFRYQRATSKRGQRLFRETREWFWSHDRRWLYAFENICEHLDLDPDYIRGRLIHPRSTHARQQRPAARHQSSYSAAREAIAA